MSAAKQYVCTMCGHNMAGYLPDNCPFCGAAKEKFMTSEECSSQYRVVETPVIRSVSRLKSHPRLGIEYAAYRIRSGVMTYWIDCPSCFDRTLAPTDIIMFTHFHFLGVSNQYREYFSSSVWIHNADSKFRLFYGRKEIRFNAFGPELKTVEGGSRIKELLEGRDISKVCAVNYVMDLNEWAQGFDRLLEAQR